MSYTVVKGLTPPSCRHPLKRTTLRELIQLARDMKPGEAVALRLAEVNTFRIALEALGYVCSTDASQCPDKKRVYAFKLEWTTDYQI